MLNLGQAIVTVLSLLILGQQAAELLTDLEADSHGKGMAHMLPTFSTSLTLSNDVGVMVDTGDCGQFSSKVDCMMNVESVLQKL